MTIVTMNSDQAHQNWQALLEKTQNGDTEVVIKQQEQPIAVLISYEKWQQLQTETKPSLDHKQQTVLEPDTTQGGAKIGEDQAVTLDELFAHIKATRPFTQTDLDRAGEALMKISNDPAVRHAVMQDLEMLKS